MVRSHEGHLLSRIDCKGKIIKNLLSINCLGKILDLKHVLSNFPVRLEGHIGETAGRWFDIIDGKLIDKLLSAGCLLCLGHVGAEALDELLKFSNLLLPSLLLILHLLCSKLG